ncbi:PepSY-associated TM helix domain-containing protein [Antarcticirhabdus aurantiaca]|uniref:PepSY domain-containing protein n=1 Tax=Antarcticirhabdus aurantiaca TaxID=2606717 RepID=A0ACD4NSL6_9HYPH|nr:PepSY domain-containing protein [Antarcticirhabdus aurantiaca]WAJ29779.1 PepSY domain-containing protein [Jeongeuplla avenae]
MTDLTASARAPSSTLAIDTYRAIWRWHFYAGLIAVPFMILLAVTGSLYLFRDEIDGTLFAHRNVVAAQASAPLPPSELVSRAQAAVPGSTLSAYREPAGPTGSARIALRADGEAVYAFVNPYTGAVLDTVAKRQEFNEVVRKLHSLDYFGSYANRLIEAIAGFAIILVVSGLYLWWPRRQTGGVVTVRGTPSKRVFWRDTHAVTGAVAGLFIAFLAVSGLPWSSFWGGKLTEIATATGTGYPAALWDAVPTSGEHAAHAMDTVGWTMESSPMPMSHAAAAAPIGLDRAVAVARSKGMAPGFEVTPPADAAGVYTAAVFPADLAKVRTIHIDQYAGEPLVDIGYADYGALAKLTELGINVHMGQEFGLANQLLMLATCLAIILSSVAALVMWLKRRPAGRLGVPPYPTSRRVYGALWAMAIAFGILFPLSGLLIVAMVAVDLLVRNVAPLRRAFS